MSSAIFDGTPLNQNDALKSSWESLRKHTVENMLTCLSDTGIFDMPTNHIANLPSSSTQMLIPDFDSDLNSVIMDYLISEGYPIAAQKFALEANIQPKVDFDSIRERVEIRNAIYGGDIQSAVEKINELNPQVSHNFFFSLRCLVREALFTPYITNLL